MRKELILVFLLGFFSSILFFHTLGYSSLEIPLMTGLVISNGNLAAPSDRISNNDIIILEDKIIINIPKTTLSSYADTGSMKPLFDKGANGIRIKPISAEDIQIGDIISYRIFGQLIVHRVIDIRTDTKGIYFITKGDNSKLSDGKVRYEDIEYITIGILY